MIWYILIALITLLIGACIFFIFFAKARWWVEVREICGDSRIVHLHRALEIKEDGIPYLKLPKTAEILPLPPSECIDITPKGMKWVVVYKHGTGNYTFCKDAGKGDKCFQPFTQTQRLVLIDQLKKAYSRQKKSLWDLVMPLAGISALVVICIALMVFYGDMGKPLLEMAETQSGIQKDQRETVRMLQEMIQKKQVLEDGEATAPPKTPENGN